MKIYYSKKRKIEWWDNFNQELLNKIIKNNYKIIDHGEI